MEFYLFELHCIGCSEYTSDSSTGAYHSTFFAIFCYVILYTHSIKDLCPQVFCCYWIFASKILNKICFISGKDDSQALSKCNACHQNPCLHDGTCQLMDFKNFTCQCTPGYYGRKCENEINACFGKPCLNKGECKVMDHGRFQ